MDTEDVLVLEKLVDVRHRVDCVLYGRCTGITKGLQIEVVINEVVLSSPSENYDLCWRCSDGDSH